MYSTYSLNSIFFHYVIVQQNLISLIVLLNSLFLIFLVRSCIDLFSLLCVHVCTMQLQYLLQVGEDVLDVSRRQEGLFGQFLVENVVQNSQHSDMCTLCVKQFCRHNTGCKFKTPHDLDNAHLQMQLVVLYNTAAFKAKRVIYLKVDLTLMDCHVM